MTPFRTLFALLALAGPAGAEDLRLALPIDCDLETTCYIQQFTDHDPSPGARDFTCGSLSYDGHKGTDFALPSVALQIQGVAVLAAASGTVQAVRDGMADILQGDPGAPDVSSVECGNGVVIDHGEGWETQYCHMAKGSIAVSPGQRVETGTPLGLVGLSGQSEFPHLHLSVRREGAIVDPFRPGPIDTCSAEADDMLWDAPPPTPPGGIVATGWSNAVPDYAAVKAGTAATDLAPDQPMVLWAYLFGGQVGDRVTLQITGPDGAEVFAQDITLNRTQAQLFRAGGRHAPDGGWEPGDYIGQVTHSRAGVLLDSQTLQVTLP